MEELLSLNGIIPSLLYIVPSKHGVAPNLLGIVPSFLGIAPSNRGIASSKRGGAPNDMVLPSYKAAFTKNLPSNIGTTGAELGMRQ